MIDFRYHLVSLIAVFLALALGILLGAGPLNQTIGDQITGQVADLREDSERLRTELEVSQSEVTNRDTFVDATAPATLGSRLEGRAIAVVALPGAEADDVGDIRHRLEQAGATVSAEVAVTEAWTEPATATFRSSFAGQIVGYLDPQPASDAGPGEILGAALGQALTRGGEEDAPVADARTLLELLASADDPLVDIAEEPETVANATVLVGPRTDEEVATTDEAAPDDEAVAEREERAAVAAALARGLATTGEGAVVSGSASTELDLVSHLRTTSPEQVTTVDSVGEVIGRVSVPMALATTISGDVGHYGFGPGTTEEVPPAVYLPPPALPEQDAMPGAPAPDGDADADPATDEEAAADDAAAAADDAAAEDAA